MRNLITSLVSDARRRKGGVGDGEEILPGFNIPKGRLSFDSGYQVYGTQYDDTILLHPTFNVGIQRLVLLIVALNTLYYTPKYTCCCSHYLCCTAPLFLRTGTFIADIIISTWNPVWNTCDSRSICCRTRRGNIAHCPKVPCWHYYDQDDWPNKVIL
jgi:hypothetical protein